MVLSFHLLHYAMYSFSNTIFHIPGQPHIGVVGVSTRRDTTDIQSASSLIGPANEFLMSTPFLPLTIVFKFAERKQNGRNRNSYQKIQDDTSIPLTYLFNTSGHCRII